MFALHRDFLPEVREFIACPAGASLASSRPLACVSTVHYRTTVFFVSVFYCLAGGAFSMLLIVCMYQPRVPGTWSRFGPNLCANLVSSLCAMRRRRARPRVVPLERGDHPRPVALGEGGSRSPVALGEGDSRRARACGVHAGLLSRSSVASRDAPRRPTARSGTRRARLVQTRNMRPAL